MSAYTHQPEPWYLPLPRRGEWISILPLTWIIGNIADGPVYTVPAGTPFDVSVPRWLHWAVDPLDHRFMKAACLHDHMLRAGWDRPTAGAIFNDALKADGVSKHKRMAMFLAVTLFKWS